jgi:Invasion associated locus B (IalB) protein
MSSVARLSLVLALVAVALPASAADQPTLLGVSREWTAYQASTSEGKVCYALSKPIAVLPKKAARDPIFVLVSTWPGRNVKDELQIVPGYPYKDGEPVYAQVGSTRTEFFTRNDANSGSAWVKEVSDEAALVAAMRGGSKMTVTGISQRGTKTTDTYSLEGITTALDRAHSACAR